MSQKTILAYLPSSRRAAHVLDAANRAAAQLAAHVIGLHVTATFPPYGDLEAVLPEETRARIREPGEQEAQAVHAIFHRAMETNAASFEWRHYSADYSEVVDRVVMEARGADLVICGNRDPDDRFNTWLDIPDRVMLESGRPVLFLPLSSVPGAFGTRALIAWNNSREAARAAFDALPLLAEGASVTLVSINPQARGASADFASGRHILELLKRRGFAAQEESISLKDSSVGEYLIKRLGTGGYDLLVMGCYGRSRLREMLLGGVTREILHDVQTLTLMSH
jgi:nucleotide-binding universal stress UspA family protein